MADLLDPDRELAAEIGQRVFQARVRPRPGKRKGFTQKDLAELSGVPQGRISEIESGQFDARALLTIRELAHALGVNERDLVFEDAPTDESRPRQSAAERIASAEEGRDVPPNKTGRRKSS